MLDGLRRHEPPLLAVERNSISTRRPIPVHIRTPEARAADEQRLELDEAGPAITARYSRLEWMTYIRQFAPEGRFGHYLMMVAALGGASCELHGRMFSDYENATGTGQVHVWFDVPGASSA